MRTKLPKQLFGPERINFDDSLTLREARRLSGDPNLRVLQTATPVSGRTWSMLNEVLFAERPDVQLRVYGLGECDLSFLRLMSNVRNVAADSLGRASNIEAIAELSVIDSLSVGVYELESFDFLHRVAPTIVKLSLGATRSRKPDLEPLRRFQALRVVYIEGHRKGLDVLGVLTTLEDVTLRSITTPDLAYLTSLRDMWSLDIKLGGIRSLDAIRGMDGIKYLELWQVRGLSDITVISELRGLQNLFLQSLPNVTGLPDLSEARRLRRVVLENMRGIRELSALEFAPALEEFTILDARGKQPDLLLPVLRNSSVRRVWAGFGSKRKNDAFARLRDESGKAALETVREFEYR